MVEIDILLSLKELHKIEDYLSKQLESLTDGYGNKYEPYDEIVSLSTIINDLIHIKEGSYEL